MAIRILPPEIASQIAAGEVVERPASVVKELLENALDAGARQVSITVEGAGRQSIEVADDGSGIPLDELSMAVSRHATSKLHSAEDLFRISSLGFRGEALASIGSVSRLTIISRSNESQVGARIRVEAGQAEKVQPVGAPQGTDVRVEELFFNVPARLKFLKTDITERRHIDELVTRYALAYPMVRFHLLQEGREVLRTSGNGNRREVLAALYGVDIARQMLEVLADYENINVTGFISPISLTRSNRREITFFVNGRWIQDAALSSALMQAYHTMLMVGRYPIAALFLDLPPQMVDVNVHPAKAEVRFRDKNQVFSGVQRAVRRALLAYTPVPELSEHLNWPGQRGASTQFDPLDWGLLNEGQSEVASETEATFQPSTFQPSNLVKGVPILRLVGQVASAYLVAEGPDGLYLVDQHAAHERVLFERFMAQRDETTPAQTLLEPVPVEFSPAGARLLAEQLPTLRQLGFEVEEFGSNTFLVRAIPALLAGTDPRDALRVLVEEFEEDETPLGNEIEARVIARVCKRAAVKAGHSLSPEEQKALLRDLEACQAPRTCPHGRPTMIHLSVDLLERQFGRKGAR
ncbi:MAG TPA: DNA mismatch repair endonuclease MutL [Anaerolineales bacterium]|nr:DNA mismatch repair endonuclease MutL [Anaerolineales bacterium]